VPDPLGANVARFTIEDESAGGGDEIAIAHQRCACRHAERSRLCGTQVAACRQADYLRSPARSRPEGHRWRMARSRACRTGLQPPSRGETEVSRVWRFETSTGRGEIPSMQAIGSRASIPTVTFWGGSERKGVCLNAYARPTCGKSHYQTSLGRRLELRRMRRSFSHVHARAQRSTFICTSVYVLLGSCRLHQCSRIDRGRPPPTQRDCSIFHPPDGCDLAQLP
jgi:hypothetical protein